MLARTTIYRSSVMMKMVVISTMPHLGYYREERGATTPGTTSAEFP
jgi:hypothetical protein